MQWTSASFYEMGVSLSLYTVRIIISYRYTAYSKLCHYKDICNRPKKLLNCVLSPDFVNISDTNGLWNSVPSSELYYPTHEVEGSNNVFVKLFEKSLWRPKPIYFYSSADLGNLEIYIHMYIYISPMGKIQITYIKYVKCVVHESLRELLTE